MLSFFGTLSLPFYDAIRNISREHILYVIAAFLFVLAISYLIYKRWKNLANLLTKQERKIVVFGILFFVIVLLPFLGLGNITSRYSYLATAGFIFLFVFIIKKLYIYLENNGKKIALASIAVVLLAFYLLHIIQIQQAHGDWNEAGKIVNRFFISIDGLYADYWSKENMEFHFVNVPIKTGEAWVFPVGLPDTLWFVFRNPNIKVYQDKSVEEALNQIEGNLNEKVFVFDAEGKVSEVIKKKNIIIAPMDSK